MAGARAASDLARHLNGDAATGKYPSLRKAPEGTAEAPVVSQTSDDYASPRLSPGMAIRTGRRVHQQEQRDAFAGVRQARSETQQQYDNGLVVMGLLASMFAVMLYFACTCQRGKSAVKSSAPSQPKQI